VAHHGGGVALALGVGLGRDEVFVTSKLNNGAHRPDDARRAFEGTLSALGFDHVDLFLIHWPLPTLYDGDYVSTWQVLEEFKITVQHELNYELEAQNLISLGRNLAEFEHIVVPQPVKDYCTKSVLTMDYISGVKVTKLGPLARQER
jgi:hypothetical protein